jgi:predicted CXXCH cytochrome family protein
VLTRATPIPMSGVLTGNSVLGANLSDDHPVSFAFNAALRTANGELADPATLVKPNAVRLDASGQLQCTSCHDPHDNTNGKFLSKSNTASALCQTCHVKNYWSSSDHRNSTKTWNGAGTPPWPHTAGTTVAANACENCHRPHTAGGGKRLLNYAAEESNCFSCHNGNVAAKNIQAEFNKASVHHVATYLGIHDPTEPASVGTAHVECVDCHNPHAANSTAGSAPGGSGTTLPGSQLGVRGVNINGAEVKPATAEYEICFRCHADGAGNTPAPRTARVIAQNNKRLEFQTANPSFHPIAAAGRSTTVPSLVTPDWSTTSRVKCTDCHNNNVGPYSTGTGITPSGTGVNGPHGSANPLLLERQYTVADNTTESAAAYALCYKCHSRTSILSNATGSFKEHNKHIVGVKTPCNVCHDPHGISSTQGTTLSNSRLMNFDTSIVTRSGTQAIRWERVGTTGGRCYLICHGANHNPWTY